MMCMKTLKLSTRFRQVLNWALIVLSVSFFAALFVFKDSLNDYASKMMQAQAGSQTIQSESQLIDSVYNYNNNGLPYRFTFLEFGAIGCSSCKRMERVMYKIKATYPNHVNVVFINIRLPENRKIMEYFGVVAIPTQVLLDKEGKEYFRHTGYIPAEELEKFF